MKISREFKVGGFIVVAAALLYWGTNFLKGNDIFSNNRTFYAVYENIEGLSVNKPVQINGLKIGQIKKINFHPDNSGRILVVFEISSDYPIPSNSIANIHSVSLLGDNVIALELGSSFDMAITGDTLESGADANMSDAMYEQIAPLKAKAEHLLNTLDTAVSQITGFLNDNTRQDFIKTFESLRATFENLERSTADLEIIIEKTEFDKMKKELEEKPQSFHFNTEKFFRSGKSYGWLSELSKDQQNKIEKVINALFFYNFIYNSL